ncbi:ferritin-like domain-containing protein [Advenella sp. RU8]|uniref:ferritin-like domain-containing protein n=1 Tax=Advenella sp. RU8 TaxID=3399575 RepID=UPI003AADBC69
MSNPLPLRESALQALIVSDPDEKIAAVQQIDFEAPIHTQEITPPSQTIPGRPLLPELVPPQKVTYRSINSEQGKAALIHSIAHIEFNAINLALDIIWRFAHLPEDFYRDWLRVAKEEAYHFSLVRAHLHSMGHEYGDFTAHNGLWEICEKTGNDLLARIALVPRTLEARGLDVSPVIQNKLASVNDHEGVRILGIILHDEVGHVELGNKWYLYLCQQMNKDPIATYADMVHTYRVAKPKGPLNIKARKQAGFTDEELAWLSSV